MWGRGIAHGWIERRVDTIGFARVLSGSSLRTQGPITPGLKSKKRPLLQCQNENPRRMGPCVRRDDSLKCHAKQTRFVCGPHRKFHMRFPFLARGAQFVQFLIMTKIAALVEDDAAVACGTVRDTRRLSKLPCFPQSGEAKNQHS